MLSVKKEKIEGRRRHSGSPTTVKPPTSTFEFRNDDDSLYPSFTAQSSACSSQDYDYEINDTGLPKDNPEPEVTKKEEEEKDELSGDDVEEEGVYCKFCQGMYSVCIVYI